MSVDSHVKWQICSCNDGQVWEHIYKLSQHNPDSKVHGANMEPTGQLDPGGPHVGPVDLAIWEECLYIDDADNGMTNICHFSS